MADEGGHVSPFLTPREVAELAKLSPHAVYRAIKRGDLEATEPVPGRLRIATSEFERWMATPRRTRTDEQARPRERRRPANQGSFAAELRAI
jgi:excisionase family DNA binding protein